MSDAAKEPAAKRINVTSHEESPPDDTAKAVILNRPMLKDPSTAPPLDSSTMTDEPAATSPEIKKPSGNKSVIKPLDAAPKSPAPEPSVASAQPTPQSTPQTESSSQEGRQEASPIAKPAPEAPAKPAETPMADTAATESEKPAPTDNNVKHTDETNVESDEAPETVSTEAEINAAAEAQAKHDEAIQKLVESKQFFLPINAVEKRKTKRFIALGVVCSLLLLLAWADIALDAGLVQIPGVKPVTHFFSN
jgi:hypothetical protein